MDWIPVLSQLKSLLQLACGDAPGARETQDNFSRQCPVVSQVRSLLELGWGDAEAATETQVEHGRMLGRAIDGLPVLGHIKGGIHYACGDAAGGEVAMRSASRSTVVAGGSIAGFLTIGPVGAFAGGVVTGLVVDGATTGVESGMRGAYTPSGFLAALQQCIDRQGPARAGAAFDAILFPLLDGFVSGAPCPEVQKLEEPGPAELGLEPEAWEGGALEQEVGPGRTAGEPAKLKPSADTSVEGEAPSARSAAEGEAAAEGPRSGAFYTTWGEFWGAGSGKAPQEPEGGNVQPGKGCDAIANAAAEEGANALAPQGLA